MLLIGQYLHTLQINQNGDYVRLNYSDVIMSAIASQITGVSIVCSTVGSGADQKNIKAPYHWPLCG